MAEQAVIAVLTYKRPGPLRSLLPELVRQAKDARIPAGVLVIDNDPDGLAAEVVKDFAGDNVVYAHEVTPGIAAARNRALALTTDERLLVFIDDDERPVANWLNLLLDCFFASHPAAVVGPVTSEFDVEPDAWVTAGDFFRRRRLKTGSEVTVAATNNLLLDMNLIRRWNLRFDEKFGISGGSDTLFTRSIVANGGRMIWCDEALVIDHVPAARVNRRWVLLRAFRSGNSWSRVSIYLENSVLKKVRLRGKLTGAGAIRVVGGMTRYVLGFVSRSRTHRAKGLRTFARGLGMLGGAYGYTYEEYRRKPDKIPT